MTNEKDILFILARLAEAYGKDLEEDQANAYVLPLSEYPRLVLVWAARWLLQKSKWFPRVSEFVQAAELQDGDYYFPDNDIGRVDEAMNWLMYRKQFTSTDQLSEKDINWIYDEAKVKRVGEVRYPDLHKGEIIYG